MEALQVHLNTQFCLTEKYFFFTVIVTQLVETPRRSFLPSRSPACAPKLFSRHPVCHLSIAVHITSICTLEFQINVRT